MKNVKVILMTAFLVMIVIACKPDAGNVVGADEFNDIGKNGLEIQKNDCAVIKDGTIEYVDGGNDVTGTIIELGYDDFGYNYQAHMFNGYWVNAYLNGLGFPPYDGDNDGYLTDNPTVENTWLWPNNNNAGFDYWDLRDIKLMMKWNDAWLSNKDCGTQEDRAAYTYIYTSDNKLDRHYPLDTYDGSGAWLTNHEVGYDDDGKKYTYSVKIITPSTDNGDYSSGGYWYSSDDVEIGPVIWGAFAIIQERTSGNPPSYISPAGAGLGNYDD